MSGIVDALALFISLMLYFQYRRFRAEYRRKEHLMDSIVVNVSELLSRLQEIQRDGMDYVEHGPIMRKSMHLKLKALDFPISSALF